MEAFKYRETSITLTWLDCYSLCREAGYNQYKTQEVLDGGADWVLAAQADIEAGLTASRAEKAAEAQTVGEALFGVGVAIMAAGIAGSWEAIVLGALIAVVGGILRWLTDLFYPPCDKYHCYGYDKNTTYRVNLYKERTKAHVGVQQQTDRDWEQSDDCSCNIRSGKCMLVQYMHDGLLVKGQNWRKAEENPSESGEVRGVNAIVLKKLGTTHVNCNEYWRLEKHGHPSSVRDPKTGKLLHPGGINWVRKQRGETLPEGAEYRPPWNAAYSNPKGTYYYRAWRVQQILYWIMGPQFLFNNILCRTLKCLQETLVNTVAVGEDSQFNQRRRRGSRWYASIVWMMQDIWRAGQYLIRQAKSPQQGWTKFGQILQDAGCNEYTLNTLRTMAAGKKFGLSETPWPFFPLFKQITFIQMHNILILLKPHFPYVYEASLTPQPYGEEERAHMPVVVPVLEPITFDQQMQPIPAKLSKPGPGLGTIMLGLGAAAVGAFALYKVLAPEKK